MGCPAFALTLREILSEHRNGGCYCLKENKGLNPEATNGLQSRGLSEAEQLERFAKRGDEEAFRSLVEAHFNLVYSSALRQVNGDTHLAQDVVQSVFADLARKAAVLPRRTVLAGWLYEAARRAAAKAVRTEQRRRMREKEAIIMNEPAPEPAADWEEIRPILDEAMGQLKSQDRNAVLLHYFERKGYRGVGAALGITDDAAQKRVSRALEKLRKLLVRRGVTVSAGALAIALSAHAVHAAPAGLSFSIGGVSLAAASSSGLPGFVTWLLEHISSSQGQLVAASGALLLITAGVVGFVHASQPPPPPGRFTTIDLTRVVNGDITASWTPDYGSNHLQQLSLGLRVLKSVPFDIRGVVQLQGASWKAKGRPLPEQVEGIPVGRIAHRLHILHANSAHPDPEGTTVARLILHYPDGTQSELPIQQGVHCLDWWAWPKSRSRITDPHTVVAWTGRNPPADHHDARLRLFKTMFANPEPEKEIKTIDYVSAMADSAPFMVGLTLEE